MKPLPVLTGLMLILSSSVLSQTFSGQGGMLIPPGAPNETVGITLSPATVTGVGFLGEDCVHIENLTMDVDHTWVGDIALFLIAPSGEVLELSSGNGGSGDDFKITVFTDFAVPFITEGSPPYNGMFRPEGRQQSTTPPFPNTNPLGTFTFESTFNGVNADGVWTLMVNDYVSIDVGVINSWSITFSQGGGPEPEVDLGPDIVACAGESNTLFADVNPGADWYMWSTGETDESITVAPTETTSYYVTVSNNGCIDADTIEVTIENTLMVDAGPDVELCEGESTILTATGGGPGASYLWNTDQMGSQIMVSPNVTSGYSVTVTDGNCTSSDNVLVFVTPIPEADAGPDVDLCEGESVTLQASGGSQGNDYTWSTGQSGDEITVSPGTTTSYTVTVSINGCEDEDEVEVFVTPTPTVDAGPDEEICLGSDVTLFATGSGGNYTWSTGEDDDQITVSPTSTTIYSVTLEDNGCEAVDDVEVTVIEVEADAGSDFSICQGEDAVLTATGGTIFEWSTGQTLPSITVSPGVTTTYSVTVSTGICEDVASVEVEVIEAPVADITPDQSICEGEAATLIVSGNGSYAWSTGETTSQITVSPIVTETYFVTVTDQICFTIVESTVTVNQAPPAFAGPDETICEGSSVQLTGAGGGTYEWSTGETTSTIDVTPLTTTTYTLTVTDPDGCTATDAVSVIVQAIPVADAGPNQFITSGGSASLNATGGGTYLWSTGETTPGITVMPTVTTTYSVTVTNGICSSVDEVIVFVDEVPSIDLGPDLVICAGETITLDATIPGPFSIVYDWSTGESTSQISVAPLVDTSYSVTVTNTTSGLSSTDTINVIVNTVPLGTPMISGPDMLCSGSNASYQAAAVSGATSYTWTVSSGATIVSGQGTMLLDVSWGAQGPGTVELVVANACGALPAILFAVDVTGPPVLSGPISGDVNPCATATSVYAVSTIPGVTGYQWTVSGGGIIVSGQGSNTLEVDWNSSPGGDICLVVNNACGASNAICLPVVTTSNPVLNAGPDTEVCGLIFDMQGSGSGNWSFVSGPGSATFALPGASNSEVTVTQPGDYVFAYSISQSGCNAYDETTVTFFDIPVITQVVETCTGALEDYIVEFSITGGSGPYTVSGGNVSGAAFASLPISAGTSYNFVVTDANGCASLPVNGVQDCNCITTAGQMDGTTVEVCLGEEVVATYLGGSTLEPGDTLAFVLHDGNLPNGIIAWSFDPVFSFQPGMVTGQTYFVSASTGNIGALGFPDMSDPCLAFSNQAPVIFNALPVASTDETAMIGCDPQQLTLDIGDSDTGPDLQYNWTAIAGGTIDGPATGDQISVISSGMYILNVVNQITGCRSSDSINVTQAVFAPTGLTTSVVSPLCPGQCNGTITLNGVQPGWLFDFGDGMETTDPVFTGACSGISEIIIRDQLGCAFDVMAAVPESEGIAVDLGPDQTIRFGESVELNATSVASVASYNWFGADTCTGCISIVVQPDITTVYEVEITDINGCVASDEMMVSVLRSKEIYVPNVFSPNGDQINDVFFIAENSRISNISLFEIYDRWGNVVFRKSDFAPGSETDGWDGSKAGQVMNPGVFTWRLVAQFFDDEIIHLSGDVTLVR